MKTFSVPYLIGPRKGTVEGTVEFVPIAELRRQAGPRGSGGESRAPVYAGAGIAVTALAALGLGNLWQPGDDRHYRPSPRSPMLARST